MRALKVGVFAATVTGRGGTATPDVGGGGGCIVLRLVLE